MSNKTVEHFATLFTQGVLTVNHGQVVFYHANHYVFIKPDHPVSRFKLVGICGDKTYGIAWLPRLIPEFAFDCWDRSVFPVLISNGVAQLPANIRCSDMYPLLKID